MLCDACVLFYPADVCSYSPLTWCVTWSCSVFLSAVVSWFLLQNGTGAGVVQPRACACQGPRQRYSPHLFGGGEEEEGEMGVLACVRVLACDVLRSSWGLCVQNVCHCPGHFGAVQLMKDTRTQQPYAVKVCSIYHASQHKDEHTCPSEHTPLLLLSLSLSVCPVSFLVRPLIHPPDVHEGQRAECEGVYARGHHVLASGASKHCMHVRHHKRRACTLLFS